jgi:hypothetical protein
VGSWVVTARGDRSGAVAEAGCDRDRGGGPWSADGAGFRGGENSGAESLHRGCASGGENAPGVTEGG